MFKFKKMRLLLLIFLLIITNVQAQNYFWAQKGNRNGLLDTAQKRWLIKPSKRAFANFEKGFALVTDGQRYQLTNFEQPLDTNYFVGDSLIVLYSFVQPKENSEIETIGNETASEPVSETKLVLKLPDTLHVYQTVKGGVIVETYWGNNYSKPVRYGFFDLSGKLILEPKYTQLYYWPAGNKIIGNLNGKKQGKAHNAFSLNGGEWFFFDVNGKLLSDTVWEDTNFFVRYYPQYNRVIEVKLNGLVGIIDTNLKYIIEPRYKEITQVSVFEKGKGGTTYYALFHELQTDSVEIVDLDGKPICRLTPEANKSARNYIQAIKNDKAPTVYFYQKYIINSDTIEIKNTRKQKIRHALGSYLQLLNVNDKLYFWCYVSGGSTFNELWFDENLKPILPDIYETRDMVCNLMEDVCYGLKVSVRNRLGFCNLDGRILIPTNYAFLRFRRIEYIKTIELENKIKSVKKVDVWETVHPYYDFKW